MNTQAIKHFFNRSKGMAIAFYICLGLLVASLIGMFINMGASKASPVEVSAYNAKSGMYGYYDIDWITDGFAYLGDNERECVLYVASAPDGTFFTVAMPARVFERDYVAAYDFYYDPEVSPQPEAVRAYGVLQRMDDELLGWAAEWMNTDTETYQTKCSRYYLDTTMQPKNEGTGIFGGLAMLSGIFTLIFAIDFFSKKSKMKKTIKRLTDQGELDLAAYELAQPPEIAFEKGKVVFTNHFLANAANGMIVKYSDALWAYVTVHSTNGIPNRQCLTVRTAQKQTLDIANDRPGKGAKGVTRAAIEELHRRCPDLLLGFTKDNNVEYNNRVAAIANGTWAPSNYANGSAAPQPQQPVFTTASALTSAPEAQIPAEEYYKDSDPTIK